MAACVVRITRGGQYVRQRNDCVDCDVHYVVVYGVYIGAVYQKPSNGARMVCWRRYLIDGGGLGYAID